MHFLSIGNSMKDYAEYFALLSNHVNKRAPLFHLAYLIKESCLLKGEFELANRVNVLFRTYNQNNFPVLSLGFSHISPPGDDDYVLKKREIKRYTKQIREDLRSIIDNFTPELKEYWNESGKSDFFESCKSSLLNPFYVKEFSKLFIEHSEKTNFASTKDLDRHKRRRIDEIESSSSSLACASNSTLSQTQAETSDWDPLAGEEPEGEVQASLDSPHVGTRVMSDTEEEEEEEVTESISHPLPESSNRDTSAPLTGLLTHVVATKIIFPNPKEAPKEALAVTQNSLVRLAIGEKVTSKYLNTEVPICDCAATQNSFLLLPQDRNSLNWYSQDVWNQSVMTSLSLPFHVQMTIDYPVHALASSKTHFVIGDHKGSVHFIDQTTGEISKTCWLHASNTVPAVDVSTSMAIASCNARIFLLPFDENGLPVSAKKYIPIRTNRTAQFLNIWDQTALIYSVGPKLHLMDLEKKTPVGEISFSSDLNRHALQRSENLLFVGVDRSIQVWDLRSREKVQEYTENRQINSLALNGIQLLYGSADGIFGKDLRG